MQVDGEVRKPQPLDIDTLLKLAPLEERICRLRCVDGWSMAIPWLGWSLAELIRRDEPTGSAKHAQFVTLADRAQMSGLRSSALDWPYVEGLRLDEAMHPLTMLAFGLCLAPFVALLHGALTDGRGPNPAGALVRSLGDWTVRGLLLTAVALPRAAFVAALVLWIVCGWSFMVPQQARLAAMATERVPVLFALDAAATYGGGAPALLSLRMGRSPSPPA